MSLKKTLCSIIFFNLIQIIDIEASENKKATSRFGFSLLNNNNKDALSSSSSSTQPINNKPDKSWKTTIADEISSAVIENFARWIRKEDFGAIISDQIQQSNIGTVLGAHFAQGIEVANPTINRITNKADRLIKNRIAHTDRLLGKRLTATDRLLGRRLTATDRLLGRRLTATDRLLGRRLTATDRLLENRINYVENKVINITNTLSVTIAKTALKVGGVVLITFAAALAIKYFYDYIKTPRLEIEQSESKVSAFFKYTILKKKRKVETIEQLILEPETKKKVKEYRDMLFFAQKNKAPMTNVLLYGPPGTGKTEIGKRIAKESNATFIYFSGASLAAFKENEAIKKMKEMFEWAKKKGNVVIFIDEIETLLPSRLDGASEQRRNLLTEFLAYTGKRSDKFAIIGASNLPQAMDGAITRRFDKAIKIGLPGPTERLHIFRWYQKKQEITYPGLRILSAFNNALVRQEIIDLTEGLSGGEIESVWTNTALNALASAKPIITPELITQEIKNVLEKKNTIGKAFAA